MNFLHGFAAVAKGHSDLEFLMAQCIGPSTLINEATALTLQLSGGSPEISLFWIKPSMVGVPKVALEEVDLNTDPVLSHEAACNSEEAVLLDYLTAGAADDKEVVK